MSQPDESRARQVASEDVAGPVERARRLLRMWSSGEGLPTTAEGVETAMVLVLSGLWAINVFQLSLASHTSIERSTNPTLSGMLQLAVVIRIAAWLCVVVRARTVAVPVAVCADLLFGVGLLLLQTSVVAPRWYNSWDTWAHPITLTTAFWSGIGLRRMWHSAFAGTICAIGYLIAMMPGASATGDTVTPLTNSAAYLAFAILGHAGARYLRRLAQDADLARLDAARTGRELERDRHRRLLHDQATVLQLLSRGEQDPDLVSALRRQAAVGAAEIRHFMSGRRKDRVGGSDLAAVVGAAAAPFTDLPLTLNVELAEGVVLHPSVSTALSRAAATILHNVRVHANAQSVVVHADSISDEWEVVVRDDGVGFDRDSVTLGFGLSEQVLAAMEEHGCRVRIESSCGEGTTVTLGGPVPVNPRWPDLPTPHPAGVPGQRASGSGDSRRTYG